ncbi:MAG: AMP-binding protein [Pseudomonadota bacterium]
MGLMLQATPTLDHSLPRRFGDFRTLDEALDYAAEGARGLNFYSARGELRAVLTYKDLRAQSINIARNLINRGVEPGARLALIAETTEDFVAVFMGCQYASVLPVPLPLPTSFGGREGYVSQLRQQMTSCGATMAIGPEPLMDLLRDATDGLNMKLVGLRSELDDPIDDDVALRRAQTEDLAYLQYSSGSTRFPHGVCVSHKSLLTNCRGQGLYGVQIQETDRAISWLPFYHDMGLVGMLLSSLCCQVSADFLSTEDFARRPIQWLNLISQNEGTTISYSPTFGYDICARRAGKSIVESLDLSRWRVAGNGGDMIRPDVMTAFVETFEPAGFRATSFVPSFGLAESTLAVSFMPLGRGIEVDHVDERYLSGELAAEPFEGVEVRRREDHYKNFGTPNSVVALNGKNGRAGPIKYRKVVNCGVPLPEYTVQVRNRDGIVVTDRMIGRVFIKGDSVMSRYFDDQDATRRVMGDDHFLDTGDMGYMSDGCLYIVGRAKDMIIINGRNLWPQDIEWAIEQLPGLRSGDIAAVSIHEPNGEESVTVLVQCRLRDLAEREAFRAEVKRKVKQVSGVVCRVELIPPRSLPRTSSGKLSRSKARDLFLSGGFEPLVAAG